MASSGETGPETLAKPIAQLLRNNAAQGAQMVEEVLGIAVRNFPASLPASQDSGNGPPQIALFGTPRFALGIPNGNPVFPLFAGLSPPSGR